MKKIAVDKELKNLFKIFTISADDESEIVAQWLINNKTLDVKYVSSLDSVKLENTLAYKYLRFNCSF
jgi:hypothetical protein